MFGVEKLFTINQQPNQHGKLFKLKVKILNVLFCTFRTYQKQNMLYLIKWVYCFLFWLRNTQLSPRRNAHVLGPTKTWDG